MENLIAFNPCAPSNHASDLKIVGAGIKIPKVFVEEDSQLIEKWILHFKKNSLCYPVIGYDSDYIKTDEGEHYHVHFLSTNTPEQLQKRREKFKVKKGPKMKFYLSKSILDTSDDCLEWLAYAAKEKIIALPDGTQEKPTVKIFDVVINEQSLVPFINCAKKKKENKYNLYLKELKEKTLKKTKRELLLEYLDSEVQEIDGSLDPVYAALIKYQIADNSYMQNFYMKEIAHVFIQRNMQKFGLNFSTIISLRNL